MDGWYRDSRLLPRPGLLDCQSGQCNYSKVAAGELVVSWCCVFLTRNWDFVWGSCINDFCCENWPTVYAVVVV